MRALFLLLLLLLAACSGGGSSVPPIAPRPAPPVVNIEADIKRFIFSWGEVPTATHYRLFENPDGHSGFTQIGADISASTLSVTRDIGVHLHDFVNALYMVQACNSIGCTGSTAVSVMNVMLDTIGYFKASNTDPSDRFGESVSISDDTLAVGVPLEDSGATGIDGDQGDNSVTSAGAVYAFTRDADSVWSQQAYIKSSNTWFHDSFGWSVALSGNTLAVGAPGEDSSATGINGDQNNDDAISAGAVYIFTRDVDGVWSQQAYIKASNTDAGDEFGHAVTLFGDTLAVGAHRERSAAIGINGDQNDNSIGSAGAVYVFARSDTGNWSQEAYIKASNTGSSKTFGDQITLSADTLAVGAPFESSGATGVNGDQFNNSETSSGAVYTFTRDAAGVWSQQAYIKASNTQNSDTFGVSVALAGDTLAVGAVREDSSATGINGDQGDNSADSAGAVYVFTRDATGVWSQEAYIKASNTGGREPPVGLPPGVGHLADDFGHSVSLSGDTLAVGAPAEDSGATGINGDQNDNSATAAGAVYVFTRDGSGVWSQRAYVKAANTGNVDFFGQSVSLSGNTLAVGAYFEDSAATGIGGDENDESARISGAVYLY